MPINCENINEHLITALLQCRMKICTMCNYILSFKKASIFDYSLLDYSHERLTKDIEYAPIQ